MATFDLLSLAEGKAAITNNAGTSNDTLLTAAITGVSQFLDEICGPIVQREIDLERADGGWPEIFLRYRPLVSITTVTEYCGTSSKTLAAETPGTLPVDGYYPDLAAGTLIRRRTGNDARFARGRGNIVVTYVAGRCADTAHVPERFKRAAGITLANYWRREHGGQTGAMGVIGVTYGLPDAAKAWIHRDIQGVMA